MSVYIAIIARILQMMLWHMDSAEMKWLWVGILAGSALKQRQCTLEGGAQNVKVLDTSSVHWKGAYSVGKMQTGSANFFNSSLINQT